jgi:SHS2 domain-containing protein
MSYKFLEHKADVKFRAEGSSFGEMFRSAADAMNEVIRGEIKIIEQRAVTFDVKGKDLQELLHNFLEEFLFLLDAEDFLVSSIKDIEVDDKTLELKATVMGDSAKNYKFTNDVKAVTYNEMVVEEKSGKFVCEVVLDV